MRRGLYSLHCNLGRETTLPLISEPTQRQAAKLRREATLHKTTDCIGSAHTVRQALCCTAASLLSAAGDRFHATRKARDRVAVSGTLLVASVVFTSRAASQAATVSLLARHPTLAARHFDT